MRISMISTMSNSRSKSHSVVCMMLLSFLSTTALVGSVAQAAVYKKIDADGNVSFSDVPDKSAQLINVAPLATVPALSQDQIARTLEDDPQQTTANANYSIKIISPASGQTYHRAVDAFAANVEVKPELKNGDRLVFLVDGKTSGQNISQDELERGQHQFEARVVSSKGRVLQSQSVTFFVQQPNLIKKAR